MESLYPDTEKIMLQRMAQGDVVGFNWVYEKYHDWAFMKSLDYVKCDAVIEDVLQNVFMKLWVNRESLDRIGMDFSRYLFVAIRNHYLNHFKKAKRRQNFLEGYQLNFCDSFFEVEEKLLAKQYLKYYTEALVRLSPSQRRIYFMVDEGMRYKDIAWALNIRLNTVNATQFNANKKVKETFKNRMIADEDFLLHPDEKLLRA